nr:serpin family protein [uncultured Sphaerochaeta sp.]
MRKIVLLFLVLLSAGSLVAQPLQEKPSPKSYSEIASTFSDELFFAGYEMEGNRMVSPLSALLALSMTMNGAVGETKSEILNVLTDSSYTSASLNAESKTYLNSIKHESVLDISNSIWMNEAFQISPVFLDSIKTNYQGVAQALDFQEPSSAGIINAYVKKATRGAIVDIIDRTSPDMLMYLINTIAFKDDWKEPFSGNDTRDGAFFGENEKKTVPFMNQEKQFPYLDGDDHQFIVLPYANERYAFVALLPDQSIPIRSYLARYEEQPFSQMLFDWAEMSKETLVRLSLPKFESRYQESLVSSLHTMGMKKAFTPGVADFSAMLSSDQAPLHIDEVLHKSFIRVDEEGTEAAAVTAVMIRLTSFMPRESVAMTLNRPFFYAILDMQEKIPLFMGILDTP